MIVPCFYLLVVVQSKHSVVVAEIFLLFLAVNRGTYAEHSCTPPMEDHQTFQCPEHIEFVGAHGTESFTLHLASQHDKRSCKPVMIKHLQDKVET